jgi:hypothetical protein
MSADDDLEETLSKLRTSLSARDLDAMRIKKTDIRWFLAQEAAQALKAIGLLPDEIPVVMIGGQLAMFVEVVDDRLRAFPTAFYFYRWPNSFEPIATFSLFWESESRRVYMSLNDPLIENLFGPTCLMVRVESFTKIVIDIFEILPKQFDPPIAFESNQEEKKLWPPRSPRSVQWDVPT